MSKWALVQANSTQPHKKFVPHQSISWEVQKEHNCKFSHYYCKEHIHDNSYLMPSTLIDIICILFLFGNVTVGMWTP